jgi:ABC-type dipeptide/oligopeptide/nickel transport system permease component
LTRIPHPHADPPAPAGPRWRRGETPWLDRPFPAPRSRVIIDNDFSGDPDDLFQVVHHLLSPSVAIPLLVASHLRPDDPIDPGADTAANAEAVLADVFARMGLDSADCAPSPPRRRPARAAVRAALITVGIGVALYYPMQYAFAAVTGTAMIFLLGLAAIAVGLLVGWLVGGPDRRAQMRNAALVALAVGGFMFVDRVMRVWQTYSNASQINGRPIATIGSQTPGLSGDYWVTTLDTFTHLVLPTIALTLISFAQYTRYSRSSLLEVMNQDYIRTARAKGLPERVVTVRHALRNALIPLATIVPLDIAYIFGGAIITERIFSWSGMGTLFLKSLQTADANPIMGYFLVIGTMLVLANVVVDLIYAALDPRIRVNA